MPPRDSGSRRAGSQGTPAACRVPLNAEPTPYVERAEGPPRRLAATPAKKKLAGKGLFELKPKGGCRTLTQQLKDYTLIALILLLTALLGNYLEKVKLRRAHGHGHDIKHHSTFAMEHAADQHAVAAVAAPLPYRALSAHADVDPVLDMQATMGICVVLISVTSVPPCLDPATSE